MNINMMARKIRQRLQRLLSACHNLKFIGIWNVALCALLLTACVAADLHRAEPLAGLRTFLEPTQATTSPTSGQVYLVEYSFGENTGAVFQFVSVDMRSGATIQIPSPGQSPSAKLAAGGDELYVFALDAQTNLPTLYTMDTTTGEVLWQVGVPDIQYAFTNARPIDRIWPSEDEESIYVLAGIYTDVYVAVIDAQAQALTHKREFYYSLLLDK